MADFKYTAITNRGKRVSGKMEGDTREQVADSLHSQGMTVISITEDLAADLQKLTSFQIGGIPLKERLIFVKQLSIMFTAGVPLLQALRILTDQAKSPAVKDQLKRICNEVESGNRLSEAFAKEKTFFNEVQINLLAAGEKSGNLSKMLLQIGSDLEKNKELQGKIRGAMIYPAIIFFVMIIVLIVVMVFMVPSVKTLYTDLGAGDLPEITQFLVNLSNFFTDPVGIVLTLIVVIFSVVGFRYYRRTPVGRKATDRLLLRIPVFGSLTSKVQVAQFCRLLSMLIKSGVPIVEALSVVSKAMPNVLFSEAVQRASVEVTKGTPLSIPLSANNVFPEILLKIIATGEDSGNLDNVLEDMGTYYTNEVNDIASNLTKLMEPLILLIVGVMVGFIAVAVYLPIYLIGQNI